jgi:hypothetical protein
LIGSDKPRTHHYLFAHRELPAIARKVGDRLPSLVETGRMDEALERTWQHVGERLAEADRLPAFGLHATVHDVGSAKVILVAMPSAEHTTEAHFVGIAFPGEEPLRYFVLEHSWTLDDQPSTVLSEWTTDAHVNLGTGPAPVPEAFLAAVSARLDGPGRVNAFTQRQ